MPKRNYPEGRIVIYVRIVAKYDCKNMKHIAPNLLQEEV